jgi:hypothetical protein
MALTAEDIRTYLKDDHELNILLEGEIQSPDALIALASKLAVSDFNAISPVSSYSVENFPNDATLLYGVLHHLSTGEAERQLRNNVNFSSQGTQVSIDDKYQAYQGLSQYYKSLFDQRAKELKHHINVASAWGESFSPYIGINDHNFRN